MPRTKPSQIHRSLPACEELLQVHDGVSSLAQQMLYIHSSRATSPCSSYHDSQFIQEFHNSPNHSRNSSVNRKPSSRVATPGRRASDDESEIDIDFYEDSSIPRRFRRSQDFGSFFTNAKYQSDETEGWECANSRAEGQVEESSSSPLYHPAEPPSARFGFPKRVSASNMDLMDVDYEGYPGAVGHLAGLGSPQLVGASNSLSAINAAAKRSRIDLRYAWQFVMKAIMVAGARSSEVPTQKQIQSKGMTTTKQQKARNFLKSIGAITVNTRTELAPRFPTLGDLRVYLESQMDPRDLLTL
jgi:hypothetical protein